MAYPPHRTTGSVRCQTILGISLNKNTSVEDHISILCNTDTSHGISHCNVDWALTKVASPSLHSDLNKLIMDYLVVEGYKSAAEEFSRETGIPSAVELATIESRMCIREAVQRGDVEEAIERVNDLNPEVSFICLLCFGPSFTSVLDAAHFYLER